MSRSSLAILMSVSCALVACVGDVPSGVGDASFEAGPEAGPTTCFIGGKVLEAGTINAASVCQSCRPDVSPMAWSSAPEGTSCSSPGICHSGACVNGCIIGSVYYAANAPDPLNACLVCSTSKSTSAWSNQPDNTSCGTAMKCTSGKCQ
jgi:hypothetical protein